MVLRVIFMGTPEFSVPTLQSIHKAGHIVLSVYTQPPRPSGSRGLKERPSPIESIAEELGLQIKTPLSLRDEFEQKTFQNFNADVAVVVAYGLLLPSGILAGTRLGCYNTHTSLLPRWRGAAPLQRAIMAGDSQTGVTIMKMEKGLDTGPIALTSVLSIEPDQTAGELHDLAKILAANLMLEALEKLEKGQLILKEQEDTEILYAQKIDPAETRIDWNKSAQEVHNHIRALSPFPGAWCIMGDKNERVKILSSTLAPESGKAGTVLDENLTIACKSGSVRLLKLQKAGGKILNASEFLRGMKLTKGAKMSMLE